MTEMVRLDLQLPPPLCPSCGQPLNEIGVTSGKCQPDVITYEHCGATYEVDRPTILAARNIAVTK